MQSITEIIFTEIAGTAGNIGLITLNRQQALNALNHAMFLSLDQHLVTWQQAANIKTIIIQAAAGRAFCAGGDIRYAYERGIAKDKALINFFNDEYRLNRRIFHYSKPYIAILNGITMGGGAGISIHGSHKVATEKLIFAMPETGIGFYPDIGATYFLTRLSSKIGFYLGLTGVRIAYNDCLAIGLVDYVIAEASQEHLIEALTLAPITSQAAVDAIIKKFIIPVPASDLLSHQQEIAFCFGKNSVEEIMQALKNSTSEWSQQTLKILQEKSPTSLKITLNALKKAEKLTFDECMDMELRLTEHFIHNHDFFEGIRAIIIDKDQAPNWQPAHLDEIDKVSIENYFL